MNRRDVLTAAELIMAASALVAATYGLIVASYDPYAAVEWVPIVAMGLGTAGAITVAAAVLFAGRTALLLAGDAVQARRDGCVAPPSAKAPLWPTSAADDAFEVYDAEQQHAEAIAAVAADTPLPERTDDTAARPSITTTGLTWGFGPTGVVDAPPWLWTAPGRHGREDVRETVGVAR